MTRAEAVILTNHLLESYPFSKGEREDKVNILFRTYKDYDREAVAYILNTYLEQKHPFYPTVEDLEKIRAEELAKADFVVKDPRNPYYLRLSPEAAARRQDKIDRAQAILKALRPKERPLLKE